MSAGSDMFFTPDMRAPAPGLDMRAVDMRGDESDMGSAPQDMRPPAQDMGTPQEDMAPPAPNTARVRYTQDALTSPLTPGVASVLLGIRARSASPDDDVLMKVGDSNTVNTNMVQCFANPAKTDLAGRTHLQDTLDALNARPVAGGPQLSRDSLAAMVGRTAKWAITGAPSPVQQEVSAINPRFALVSYGTNDMQQAANFMSALFPFHDNFAQLLDALLAQGIIPIITGLPPRGDSAQATQWARTFNDLTRAVAEARQLPYIDLLQATESLPNQGLVGDGLHGNSAPQGACVLTDPALDYGFNMRNLLTLTMLDGVRDVVLGGAMAPDAPLNVWRGVGTPADPIIVDALPFGHAGSTAGAPSDMFEGYPACDSGQNESGPEVVYRVDLSAQTTVRAMVMDQGDVDVDLHLLGAGPEAASCVARHDRFLEVTLQPGTHHFVVDTFVSSSKGERSGDFLFVLSPVR